MADHERVILETDLGGLEDPGPCTCCSAQGDARAGGDRRNLSRVEYN